MEIGVDECDAAFALTFFLTTLVNISSPVLFYILQFFCYWTLSKRCIQIDENFVIGYWGVKTVYNYSIAFCSIYKYGKIKIFVWTVATGLTFNIFTKHYLVVTAIHLHEKNLTSFSSSQKLQIHENRAKLSIIHA